MALLSRKVDYALLVLSYLHHRDAGGCARAIAERFGLKKAFTAKVLKQLCRQGLVRGSRGLHGGYVLARPAQDVRLCDLLDLLDEPFHLADCGRPVEEGGCGLSDICPVREAVAEVDRRIREVLRAVTLAELFRPTEAPQGARFGLSLLSCSPLPRVGEGVGERG